LKLQCNLISNQIFKAVKQELAVGKKQWANIESLSNKNMVLEIIANCSLPFANS
jgi:hypothetical protein